MKSGPHTNSAAPAGRSAGGVHRIISTRLDVARSAWDRAQADSSAAWQQWRRERSVESFAVYLAASDREDAAVAELASAYEEQAS